MAQRARLPIRLRITVIFAVGLALVVGGLSLFVYLRTGADLLDATDAGLASRVDLLRSDLQQGGRVLLNPGRPLVEDDEVFAQIADPGGNILESTASVSRTPLLPASAVKSLDRARFYDRVVPGVDNVTRVLAVPAITPKGRLVVIAGSSLQDRADELTQLAASLAIGGPAAAVIISGGAWLALGGALRPVERMRRQAAGISASDPGRRLSPPGGRDEIALLGATLNQMLDRIEDAVDRERRLVDWASHELRTPLAIQRMDLDLALTGPQTVPELAAALRSVSVENAHLARLTEDLLVLSRARGGALPIRRIALLLPELLAPARRRSSELADGVHVNFHDDGRLAVVDPVWFRQAVHNLVDNAVRHTPAGGQVTVSATSQDGTIMLIVEDTGPGFAEDQVGPLSEPFAPAAQPGGQQSTGLGLAVVRMIADAHGGQVRAENRAEGGARITVFLPDR